jgi:hypothetical protein
MRKLKVILDDTEKSGANEALYPAPPPGYSGLEKDAGWRAQCLLMSAEIRYPMYLQLLEKWVTAHSTASKDEWPLPPW